MRTRLKYRELGMRIVTASLRFSAFGGRVFVCSDYVPPR